MVNAMRTIRYLSSREVTMQTDRQTDRHKKQASNRSARCLGVTLIDRIQSSLSGAVDRPSTVHWLPRRDVTVTSSQNDSSLVTSTAAAHWPAVD